MKVGFISWSRIPPNRYNQTLSIFARYQMGEKA
jgi:hypothetical protein